MYCIRKPYSAVLETVVFKVHPLTTGEDLDGKQINFPATFLLPVQSVIPAR